MTITPKNLISFVKTTKERNCEVSDILDLCYQKNASIIVQRQLPKEEQENIKSKIYFQFSSAVVFCFERLHQDYKFSDEDIVAALIGDDISEIAMRQVQELLKKHSAECSPADARKHIREFCQEETFGNSDNRAINQEFFNKIKELADSRVTAKEICRKFTDNEPDKPYSDPMLWCCLKIWKNFDLISDKQIQEYEQILEQPYWSLGVGYDPYGRNFISLLLCQKKIIGKPGQPILMIQPGKTYEDVVDKEAFHWYLRDEVTIENLFLLREDLDIFKDMLIAADSIADRDKKQKESNLQMNNRQKLTRSAIKKNYTRLSGNAWDHRFRAENKNGLIAAKVQDDKPYLYLQSKVEEWLCEKGIYTPQELAKPRNVQKNRSVLSNKKCTPL